MSVILKDQSVFHYRDTNIKWKTNTFKLSNCTINSKSSNNGNYILNGELHNDKKEVLRGHKMHMKYWAASSPDRRLSNAGSALPFPNEDVAFEGTNNCGIVPILNGRFKMSLLNPNSYYKNMGTILVPPTVEFQMCDEYGNCVGPKQCLILRKSQPYRNLYYDVNRTSPNFYKNKFIVRGQESILRDSGYQNSFGNSDFWGYKPTL